MSHRFVVALTRNGQMAEVTMTEYSKDRKVLYSITYPITYTEACEFGRWATFRNVRHLCDTFLTANGWDVWLPLGSVINPDVTFTPHHDMTRSKPHSDYERYYMGNAYHKVQYASV